MDGLQMYQRALQLFDLSSWAANGSPHRRLTTFHTNVLVVLVLLDYISSAWVGNHLCWIGGPHPDILPRGLGPDPSPLLPQDRDRTPGGHIPAPAWGPGPHPVSSGDFQKRWLTDVLCLSQGSKVR